MKYQLMVSHDCGMHYHTEATSDDVMAFAERCKELDDMVLRWTIADEQGNDIVETQFTCRIFRDIFTTIELARMNQDMKPFYEAEADNEAPD